MDGEGTDQDGARYRLTLSGAGVTVEREIPGYVAARIISMVMGGSNPPGGGTSSWGSDPTMQSQGSGVVADTVGEFLQATGATSNPEKILAIAVFLAERKQKADFSRADIRAQFRAAGEPNPANFPRDFQKAVASRWLAPVEGSKDSFFVTNTGRGAVSGRFDGPRRGAVTRPIRRRSRRASGASLGASPQAE